jgi:hypothetical protein
MRKYGAFICQTQNIVYCTFQPLSEIFFNVAIIFGKLQSVHLIGRPTLSAIALCITYTYVLSVSDHSAFGYIASSESFAIQFSFIC